MPFKKTYEELELEIKSLDQQVVRLKQAEEALKENEEQYRILTENIVVGVALIQDGRFLFVNRAFFSMFGFKKDMHLIGKEADKIFDGLLKRGGANFWFCGK